MKSNNIITEFKVTRSADYMAKLFGLTPEIQKIQLDNHYKLSKPSIIEKLKKDIEKYPTIPQLKQQLHSAYIVQDKKGEAEEVVEWIYTEHPNYLFGLINKALNKYYDEDYEAMLDYLGQDLNLKSLYPEREEFHVDEVMNYLCACAMYRNATEEDDEQVNTILKIMKGLDNNSPIIDKTIKAIFDLSIKKITSKIEEEEKAEKHPYTEFIQSVPKTNKPPVFENALFEELYTYDCNIDKQILKDILALPQHLINSECKKIINDSIARFYYFEEEMEDDFSDVETHFIFHVLFLLGETKNPDNLPLVLQILRQAEDYCELYLSEIIVTDVWWVLYNLSAGNEELLLNFLKEPNLYFFGKSAVIDALEQIAIKQPQKKEQVLKLIKNLLEFFYENKYNEDIFDSFIIANVIFSLVVFNNEESYSLIQKMYSEKLVSPSFAGSYEELMLSKAKNEINPQEKILNNIFTMYDEVLEVQNAEDDEDDEDEDEFDEYEEIQPIRTEPKIGRNDDCPCGSGKKYKKCCLEKGIF